MAREDSKGSSILHSALCTRVLLDIHKVAAFHWYLHHQPPLYLQLSITLQVVDRVLESGVHSAHELEIRTADQVFIEPISLIFKAPSSAATVMVAPGQYRKMDCGDGVA